MKRQMLRYVAGQEAGEAQAKLCYLSAAQSGELLALARTLAPETRPVLAAACHAELVHERPCALVDMEDEALQPEEAALVPVRWDRPVGA